MKEHLLNDIEAMVLAAKGGLWTAEYEMKERASVIIPELLDALKYEMGKDKDTYWSKESRYQDKVSKVFAQADEIRELRTTVEELQHRLDRIINASGINYM